MNSGLIKRVVLRNYRSIAHCDVELSPLTVIVGRNAAGKSNFVDALRFAKDALRNRLADALQMRGGFGDILWKESGELPQRFSIEIELGLDVGAAVYAFVVEASDQSARISSERLGQTEQRQWPSDGTDRSFAARLTSTARHFSSCGRWENRAAFDALSRLARFG